MTVQSCAHWRVQIENKSSLHKSWILLLIRMKPYLDSYQAAQEEIFLLTIFPADFQQVILCHLMRRGFVTIVFMFKPEIVWAIYKDIHWLLLSRSASKKKPEISLLWRTKCVFPKRVTLLFKETDFSDIFIPFPEHVFALPLSSRLRLLFCVLSPINAMKGLNYCWVPSQPFPFCDIIS